MGRFCYWVGGTGTWTASNTANWAGTSGGTGGTAPVPTGSSADGDVAVFNASSGGGTVALGISPTVGYVLTTGFTGTFNGASQTITLVGGGGEVWDGGCTLTGTPNFIISDSATNPGSLDRIFTGANRTYGNLALVAGTNGATTGAFQINNGATFNTISSTRTVAYTITLNNTVTVATWTVSGSAGKLVTLNSSVAGTQRTLTKTGGGQISVNYLSIRDIAATPNTLTWYAGANSTNVSNNTGWIFTAPPVPIVSIGPGFSIGAGFTIGP